MFLEFEFIKYLIQALLLVQLRFKNLIQFTEIELNYDSEFHCSCQHKMFVCGEDPTDQITYNVRSISK